MTDRIADVRPLHPVPNPTTPPTADWSTSSHGYTPNEFYTSATDHRGDRSMVRISLPPSIATQIAELVQQGRIPEYRTLQDVVRDALVHRLHYVAELLKDPQLNRSVNLLLTKARVDSLRAQNGLEESVVEGLLAALHDAGSNPANLDAVISAVDGALDNPEISEANKAKLRGEAASYRRLAGLTD